LPEKLREVVELLRELLDPERESEFWLDEEEIVMGKSGLLGLTKGFGVLLRILTNIARINSTIG